MGRCEFCGGAGDVKLVKVSKFDIEACTVCRKGIEDAKRREQRAAQYDAGNCDYDIEC